MGMTNDGLAYWQAERSGTSLVETTVGDLLDRRATENPTKDAIVYSCYPESGDLLNIRWAYAAYREHADAVARGLLALGLRKGAHIAVWAINLPTWLLLQMAAAKIGAVLVTVNPALQAREVAYILKQGDVQALFFMAQIRSHDCLATLRSLTTPGSHNGELSSAELPYLRYACLLGATPPDLLDQEGWRPTLFEEMVAAGQSISSETLRERQAAVRPHDTAMIQYTSGTTGFPKGVMMTHYSIVNNAAAFMERWGAQPEDRACTAMPFFHVGGCVLAVLGAIYAGSALYPMLAFDTLKALQILSTGRCTSIGAVPTMLLAMLQHPDFAQFDLSALRSVVSGATAVPVYLMEQVKERMGADVAIVFGMTEFTSLKSLLRPRRALSSSKSPSGVALHIQNA